MDGALKACEMEGIRVAFWGKWAAGSCISADFLMLRFKSTDIQACWLVFAELSEEASLSVKETADWSPAQIYTRLRRTGSKRFPRL